MKEKKIQNIKLIKIIWDEDFFYILADIKEPHIWGNINKKDAVIYLNNNFEIFIDVKMDVLKERDSKKLYENYDKGLIKDVVGCDISFDEPISCDYRIENNSDLKSLFSHISKLKSIIDV